MKLFWNFRHWSLHPKVVLEQEQRQRKKDKIFKQRKDKKRWSLDTEAVLLIPGEQSNTCWTVNSAPYVTARKPEHRLEPTGDTSGGHMLCLSPNLSGLHGRSSPAQNSRFLLNSAAPSEMTQDETKIHRQKSAPEEEQQYDGGVNMRLYIIQSPASTWSNTRNSGQTHSSALPAARLLC